MISDLCKMGSFLDGEREARMTSTISCLIRSKIGDIGEDLPSTTEFTGIINLNALQNNFPIFDHIALKNGEVYAFSVKARKKYGANGKINSSYNILYNSDSISRKWKKAMDLFESNGYDIGKIHFCFLVAPLEDGKDTTYYWGELTSLNPECTTASILAGKIKRVAVGISDDMLSRYSVFGSHSWEYIKNTHLTLSE